MEQPETADPRRIVLRRTLPAFAALGIPVVVLLPPVVSGGYSWTDPAILAYTIGLPMFLACWLAIPKHFEWARHGFVATTALMSWIFTWRIQGTGYLVGNYAFLSVIVMFAAFFLGVRATAAYAGLNIVGVLIVHYYWRLALADLVLSLTYLVVFSVMLTLIAGLLGRQGAAVFAKTQELAVANAKMAAANGELVTVLDHTGDAIVHIAPDGTLLSANARALHLFGAMWGSPLKMGGHLLDSVPPEIREQGREALASANQEGPTRHSFAANGVELDVRMVRLDDGSVLSVATDVTAENMRDAIEREDAERRAEVAKLEAVTQMQREFMTIASHELQGPLTPVRLQLHVLRDRKTGSLNASQLRCVDVIERNSLRLSNMVSQISDIVRIDNHRLPVDLGDIEIVELTRQEIDRILPLANAKDVSIAYSGPSSAWAHGDARRLEKVMRYILDNALKFSRPGGAIRINVGADQSVRWQIVDDGIGFDPELKSKLFKPFTQLHQAPDLYGGSGLGLAISKGYIEAQGGGISAQSEGLGLGAAISFWLPVATRALEHEHSTH